MDRSTLPLSVDSSVLCSRNRLVGVLKVIQHVRLMHKGKFMFFTKLSVLKSVPIKQNIIKHLHASHKYQGEVFVLVAGS